MKKTIVTLIAMSSIASAAWTAAEFDKYMSGFIADSGYQAGDSFTLDFTLKGTYFDAYRSGMLFHLASNDNKTWGIFTQAGTYIALENTTVNDRGWNNPTTQDLTTGVFEWTSTDSTFGGLLDSWVSYQTTLNKDGNYHANPGLESIKIEVNSTGSTITLGMLNGTTSIVKTAYIINANDIKMGTTAAGNNINENNLERVAEIAEGGTFTVGGNTYTIPEPTTATLSLLALAGLAARRRRR